jgi:hypothetical protein
MARTFIRQETQIYSSDTYTDSTTPSLANYETNPTHIETDLNNLRSQVQNMLNRNGDSFPSDNWYDDLTKPTTLENGTIRGIDANNAALHLVEKKRVLRDVWKILDIYPGLDTAIALLNDIKTQYEAHRVLTAGSVHGAADSTNVVTAADATNLATLITLADDLRTQYEAHRVLTAGAVHGAADTTNAVTATAVGSTVDFHVLTAAQLPTTTTAAIGAVTTLGTVAAYNASFGAGDLAEVTGSTAVAPKNLMPLVDADNHLDPILIGGKQLFGLFQTESNTDGSTMTGTTPNRAQVSFVVRNDDGDDLELANVPTTQGINFATRERKRFEDLDEQDFLKGVTIEFPASTTVTRQVAYNNQGTTAVNLTTNATLDLEGAGLAWTIRDDAEQPLFTITEGSSGGTSKVAINTDTDLFDVDAADNDFLHGASFDTGAAGTTINIGTTANTIDAGGALTVQAGGSGNLNLDGNGGEVLLDDINFSSEATWSQAGVKVTETTTEITTYESNFGGEVSLFNAINQAYSRSARTKGYAIVTSDVAADTDVANTTAGNLDQDLPDYSGVGTFVDDVDVYLNGELLRNGADAAANHDVYPGTTPAVGMLKFEFGLKGTGAKKDQLCMIVWSS